jgi:RNA polymerase sigma-70 factor (ECF subfamily)
MKNRPFFLQKNNFCDILLKMQLFYALRCFTIRGRNNNVMTIEETVRSYSDMLYRLALAKTGNSHDAQDVIQEVFLRLIRYENTGKTFKDEEHRKAWLIRVTINLSINTLRVMSKHDSEFDDSLDYISDNDEITRFETRSVVLPAVQSLDEKYRVIIHLFYYEDMTITEICKITDLPVNTVKSRLLRARNKLKEILKEVEFDEEL